MKIEFLDIYESSEIEFVADAEEILESIITVPYFDDEFIESSMFLDSAGRDFEEEIL